MNQEFLHPKTKRVIVISSLFIMLLCALVNYYVIYNLKPPCDKSSTVADLRLPEAVMSNQAECGEARKIIVALVPDITTGLITASLTVIFFSFLRWISGSSERRLDEVEVLFQPDQRKVIQNAAKKGEYWCHDGHLASWVCEYVVPIFLERSKAAGKRFVIKSAIINPENINLCQLYLDHCRRMHDGYKRIDSVYDIQVQLCASIVELAYQNITGHIDVELYLKDRIDLIRDDFTGEMAFWTTLGSGAPGIALRNNEDSAHFYNLVVRNFNENLLVYKRIDMHDLAKEIGCMSKTSVSDQFVSIVLRHLFPECQALLKPDTIGSVLGAISKRR